MAALAQNREAKVEDALSFLRLLYLAVVVVVVAVPTSPPPKP